MAVLLVKFAGPDVLLSLSSQCTTFSIEHGYFLNIKMFAIPSPGGTRTSRTRVLDHYQLLIHQKDLFSCLTSTTFQIRD